MSSKESILNKIADYLARRDHSVKEIKEKLAQKKIYEPEKIDEAIQKAIDQKWFIPEHELSEKVARSLAIKKKSHFFISNYLKEKGLPPVDFSEELEVMAIQGCLIKKFRNPQNLDFEDTQKAMHLLSSRGFDRETCYKVLGNNHEIEL
jgi:SOS response regulatory protein OraA/RecX